MIATLSPKDPAEVITVTADFSTELAAGETIRVPTNTITTVPEGRDPNAADMLIGTPEVVGGQVLQMLEGGIDGTTYLVTCVAPLSSGRILVRRGSLLVSSQ
jgi:hypothetical protein